MAPGQDDTHAEPVHTGAHVETVAKETASLKAKRELDITGLVLVETGEIENRLRQQLVALMEPCLRKQAGLEARIKDMKAGMDQQSEVIAQFQQMFDSAENLRSMVDGFRAQLAEWDAQRCTKDQVSGERLSQHDMELNTLKQSMETRVVDANSTGRAIKGLSETIQKTQSELEELRKYCVERWDVLRDKMFKMRDEVETRQLAFESQQHQLMDGQTSTDMLVRSVKGRLDRVTNEVSVMTTQVSDLQRTRATVDSLQAHQQDFHKFSEHLNAQVNGLKEQFGGLVSDLKAHFESALQVVGVSTAQQMDDVRARYGSDADKLSGTLAEMDRLVKQALSAETELREEMAHVKSNGEAKLAEFRSNMDAAAQRRDASNNALLLEVGQLRKQLREITEQGRGGFGRGDTNEVLTMLVESEILSAILDLQDDQDRKNISLFGYKGGAEARQPQLPGSPREESAQPGWTLPELDLGSTQRSRSQAPSTPSRPVGDAARTPRRRVLMRQGDPEAAAPVVTLDKRCLSCSGSTATVLAGFKLACLQYAPSPVVYRDVPRSRSELIRLRLDLLNQAKEELRSTID